jgi:GntR family transcriptional regulator
MLWRGDKLAPGPIPLWFQIAERLRGAIEGGEFGVGEKVPSESDLNREFGVSRTTARAALDQLEHEGLIVRRSGKGSIVVPKRVDQPLKALAGFGQDMRARGLVPSYRTRSVRREPADAEVADAVNARLGERIVAVDRVLCAYGAPMAVSRSWLSPQTLGRRQPPSVVELNVGSLYAWLMRHCGVRIVGGEEFIEAAVADEPTARRLEIGPGEATLVARRTMRCETGAVVEYSVMRYRADRYRYRIELGSS